MNASPAQRAYRAPCPGCGAPVEFKSAQSTHAVCGYCHSTVVRSGDVLQRLGRMAELFDDHSPLQLQASGRWEGQAFTLVGRLQYQGDAGPWTEWHAALDGGESALLSEDNGAYIWSRVTQAQRPLPPAQHLRLGATTAIDGTAATVSFAGSARLLSAQGELPKLPSLDAPFAMVELRSAEGEVLTIDYGVEPPQLTRGRAVRLEELALSGLREDSVRQELQARQFACPNCGAPVAVQLQSTQRVTCASCDSVIDVTGGVGSELRHALQDEPVRPLIALGSRGTLQGADWQVVGFQHRMGHTPGEDEEDESFGWSEYLLYNRQRGFIFLVDAEDGWSVVKPTSGAPKLAEGERSATYLGTRYTLKWAYEAETTYVAGEFYWSVERGHKSSNRDFASGPHVLSLEQTARERTWSAGSAIASDTVAQAFGLTDKRELLKRGDAGPISGKSSGLGCGCLIVLVALLILLVLVMAMRQRDPDEQSRGSGWRGGSSGGSWGGYSSGGGHK